MTPALVFTETCDTPLPLFRLAGGGDDELYEPAVAVEADAESYDDDMLGEAAGRVWLQAGINQQDSSRTNKNMLRESPRAEKCEERGRSTSPSGYSVKSGLLQYNAGENAGNR